MDDDDFGTDADFLEALAASEASSSRKVVQPTPQKLDRPVPGSSNTLSGGPKVIQPTPQAIPGARSVGSSILVSPRQKGNPILTQLRSLPWEYSDIPSDYVLGATTCALFLSLKYHRLHPDYIYNRIKSLQGKYNLRIILTMIDIQNHEESLKELSKTSLINNVTVILCWSAAEAARYLELYKSYEHANHSAIREVRGTSYTERLVDFVTVPRSINKTDAVSLVSAFGSVRGAVNARPEEIAVIGGWGEKKVRKWCEVVQEPFRTRKTAKRGLLRGESSVGEGSGHETPGFAAIPIAKVPLRETGPTGRSSQQSTTGIGTTAPMNKAYDTVTEKLTSEGSGRGETPRGSEDKLTDARGSVQTWEPGEDEEEAMIAAALEEEERLRQQKRQEQLRKDNELSEGVAAALAKLRKD